MQHTDVENLKNLSEECDCDSYDCNVQDLYMSLCYYQCCGVDDSSVI